jgi:hypothetical protein
VLTWAVESLSTSDVKHDPSNGEQNSPTVVPIELCEGARGICRVEQRGRVRAGHPRVASVGLCGGRARDGGGGKENALDEVEDVEEEGGVDWVREQGRHLAEVDKRKNKRCRQGAKVSDQCQGHGREARSIKEKERHRLTR